MIPHFIKKITLWGIDYYHKNLIPASTGEILFIS